ncbi:hypothetical protein GEMRC1_004401 [Eukaryota sp. GEM-RC1]
MIYSWLVSVITNPTVVIKSLEKKYGANSGYIDYILFTVFMLCARRKLFVNAACLKSSKSSLESHFLDELNALRHSNNSPTLKQKMTTRIAACTRKLIRSNYLSLLLNQLLTT